MHYALYNTNYKGSIMFQITAVFNRIALPDVLQGLYDERIQGITVTNVAGKGAFGFIESDLDEKVMITIVVSSQLYKEKAMEAIRSNTQDTGHGSGKMWITPVLEVERIRTGEKDAAALSHSNNNKTSQNDTNEFFSAEDTPAS
jgi:nitrogen regulatory protein P-II 1